MEKLEQELRMSDMEEYGDKVERTGNGFTTKLFWCSNDLVLPDNVSMALKRLNCIERKLEKNPKPKLCGRRQQNMKEFPRTSV